MRYGSRKFIIFFVVYFTVFLLFIFKRLSEGNFVILVGQCLTFYLGGNAFEKYTENKVKEQL